MRISQNEVTKLKKPDRYVFPAIFTEVEDGAWEVCFPDIENGFTAAESLEQAILEAKFVLEDILYFTEKEKLSISASTPLGDIKAPKGAIVQLVVADMQPVRREYGQKAVKKTLSIPAWMEDELKQRSEINVSQVLQEALKRELKRSA